MRFLSKLISAVLLSFSVATAFAAPGNKSIIGKVFLDPESRVPGDYVMVYFPALGTGTMTDEWGGFNMTLPRIHPNKMKVEYSRIGYETIEKTIVLTGDITDLGTVNMKVQTLMLTAAYVTPDGMSPSEFILSKVWEKTYENRKKKLTYGADINYEFSTHEIPLVASTLPKGQVGLAKIAVGLMGYGSLVNYCLKNDDISASAELSRTVSKGGKPMDFNQKITKSNPSPLPSAVQKDIIKFFHGIDLFDLVYGEFNDIGHKFSNRHKFKLVGTYEYGNKLVDVLSWTGKEKITINIHVVEEEWGILKLQCTSREGEVLRGECRDTGNGVYMPISFIMKPSLFMVRPDQIPALIEEVEKSKDFNKATKERMKKVLQDRLDNNQYFNPYFSCGFNVRYR